MRDAMTIRKLLWILLIATVLLVSEKGRGVFLQSIGPMAFLCATTYGGYYLCRRLLFWLGGVGETDDGIDDSFKKWLEQNRKQPPK
jgi:hypothetical protein